MSQCNISALITNNGCSMELLGRGESNFLAIWHSLLLLKDDLDSLLYSSLEETPHLISISKWGKHLPEKYKVALIKQKTFDFEGTFQFIANTKLITT